MNRSTLVAAALALIASAVAIVFYVEKRDLQRELDARPAPAVAAANDPWASTPREDDARDVPRLAPERKLDPQATDAPKLPDAPSETRMQRRARRQAELAGLLGREDGETDQEYKDRILPLLEAALAGPRKDLEDMRSQAEQAAGVTAEQHDKLDAAFKDVYGDLIDYTNGAIADGQLSPYERNVAGMLDYAGGLGGMLSNAQGRIDKILTPAQIKAMSAGGFEWAEYLGVSAPWEQLNPPPPPPGGGS